MLPSALMPEKLEAKKVAPGLYVVPNAYSRDRSEYDYFAPSPLAKMFESKELKSNGELQLSLF